MALVGGGVMKRSILLKGPLLTRSGYGEHARFVLRCLRNNEELFDIYIQPLQWGATSWISDSSDERVWIDNRIQQTIAYIQQGGRFDISLQITIPNEWEKIAPVNIGVTAGIETTKVAPLWLQKGNEVVDRIITISNHSVNSYKNTIAMAKNNQTGEEFEYKLQNPIDFVNYPVKNFDNLDDLSLNLPFDINFLSVAQFGPRKNLPNTVKWFVEEFHNDNVGLVVKTNMAKNCLMDREIVINNLKNIVNQFPDRKCKVYLLHGEMTDKEMHSLYRNEKISAFLALPHGEGFGLPIFEAAYSGLPVVATGWSGHLDFLTDENNNNNFYNVSFDMQPVQKEVVWENVIIPESMWAYPREQSAKQQMRQCYEDIFNDNEDTHVKNACEYSLVLKERFSFDKVSKKFIDCINSFENKHAWLNDIEDIIKEYE